MNLEVWHIDVGKFQEYKTKRPGNLRMTPVMERVFGWAKRGR